ncbi:Hexokinase-4 [Clonorchis sinensis]|uniref:Phosphotransferase n=1 Tax=Clonorchis sinensis TaxID=79923 RepID=A0A8T1MCT8_CLOSI|nr:Hexokinase-4 [Clonorchis sinensis]
MDNNFRSIRSIRSLDLLNSARREDESFLNLASEEVKKLCSPLLLDTPELEDLMNKINKELDVGLSTEDDKPKELKMLNTFVKEISSQRIPGRYISLDFKGRYYRILLVTMSAEADKTTVDETLYTIPKKVRTQSGEAVRTDSTLLRKLIVLQICC